MSRPASSFDRRLGLWTRALNQEYIKRDRLRLAQGFCLWFGLALLVGPWAPLNLFRAIVALGILGTVGARWWMKRKRLQALAPNEVIKAAEDVLPRLGSSLSSAHAFHLSIRDKTFLKKKISEELAQSHIDTTTKGVDDAELASRFKLSRVEHLKRARLWALVGVLAVVLILGFYGKGRRQLLRTVLGSQIAAEANIPVLADIMVEYRYPAYTGFEVERVEGSDGSLEAPEGTIVNLRAKPDRPIRRARFRWRDGEGAVPEVRMEGDEIVSSITMQRSGLFDIEIQDRFGEWWRGPQAYIATALPDEAPKVRMISPTHDVEVRDTKAIDILWEADDEYGISSMDLVFKGDDRELEHRIPIDIRSGEATAQGREHITLAELPITPGEPATFYLEAKDNRTGKEGGVGQSDHRRLLVFSAQRHHEDVILRQQEALNALVDWLGRELVRPAKLAGVDGALDGEKELLGHIEETQRQFGKLVEDISDDELASNAAVDAFHHVGQHVEDWHQERVRGIGMWEENGNTALIVNRRAEVVRGLETDIIYLDDLLALQRIETLKHNAEELLAAQRDLKGLLEQYRETGDEDLKRKIAADIERLRRQMLDVMARMAAIKAQLPGEYRNMEAARMNELNDQLNKLEEQIASGDLEAAAKELENLAASLERMMSKIDETEQSYGEKRYTEAQEMMRDFEQDFSKLEKEQEALAKRSYDILQRYQRMAEKRAGGSMLKVQQNLLKLIGESLRRLDDIARLQGLDVDDPLDAARQDSVDFQALVEASDLSGALRIGKRADLSTSRLVTELARRRRQFKGEAKYPKAENLASDAQRGLEKAVDILSQIFPDPNIFLSEADKNRMQAMKARQKELQDKAVTLEQKMRQIDQKAPVFGDEAYQEMSNARRAMEQGQDDLRRIDVRGSAGQTRAAADSLRRFREGFEQGGQGQDGQQGGEQGQGGQEGGQGQRGGRSSAGGGAGGGGNKSIPKPFSSRSGNRRPGRGRETGTDPIQLPGVSTQGDRELLREILDASKREAPEGFEESKGEYYKEITQ